MTKQYRLLKDLPGVKAGTVYDYESDYGRYTGADHTMNSSGHELDMIDAIVVENNPEWFEVVRWKPKDGEEYYFFNDSELTIWMGNWLCCFLDEKRWFVGNCFPTKEEAEQARERVRKALRNE
jgi:hypothetical protein